MSNKSLSKPEIALHWIVGLGMIGLIAVGVYMTETHAYYLYPTHKSIGALLLIFIVVRAVIRLRKGWPETVSEGPGYEKKLASVVHWVLLIATLIMPVSGMIGSMVSGHGLAVFGLEIVGANIAADGQPVPVNATLATVASAVHGITAKLVLVALALHIAGALKHHFIDRDSTMRRMLGVSD